MHGYAPDFLVLTLPRSRSYWLSRFLSYQWRDVRHDLAVECASIPDFAEAFHDQTIGSVETGGMLGWRTLRYLFPAARIVIVRRTVDDVIDSFRRAGYEPGAGELEQRAALLDGLSGEPGVNTIQYKALASEECCAWLFEHCLGIKHDRPRWQMLSQRNLQIDLPKRFDLLKANAERIAQLKAEVAAAEQCLSS